MTLVCPLCGGLEPSPVIIGLSRVQLNAFKKSLKKLKGGRDRYVRTSWPGECPTCTVLIEIHGLDRPGREPKVCQMIIPIKTSGPVESVDLWRPRRTQ